MVRVELLRRSMVAALACALASGCAMQLGAGIASRRAEGVGLRPTVVASTRLLHVRTSGTLLGARVTLDPRGGQTPLPFRNASLEGGGHARHCLFSWLGCEGALELGLGEPTLEPLGGIGFYAGGSAALLFRLAGHRDSEDVFAVFFGWLDLVLTGRAGVWSAPRGTESPTRFEGTAELALRVTFASDLASSRAWRDDR